MEPTLDLNEKFLTVLKEKYPKQTSLITVVEENLKIERESAYRRIKGIVQFSIREMGILAKSLNISLDSLLNDSQINVVNLHLLSPRIDNNSGLRISKIDEYLKKVKLAEEEIGGVYSMLPTEFYLPYKYLFKFMYYKWDFYYVCSDKHKDFAQWRLPDNIINQHSNIMNAFTKVKKVVYVWNKSIFWDLVNDIKFFLSTGMMNMDDVDNLKRDLHSMLNDMETFVATGGPENNPEKIEFYISHAKIGITYLYLWGKEFKSSFIVTVPIVSTINECETTCENVRKWVKSLKKISTLISGTGEKERILYFKEQHQIIDSI